MALNLQQQQQQQHCQIKEKNDNYKFAFHVDLTSGVISMYMWAKGYNSQRFGNLWNYLAVTKHKELCHSAFWGK
jgi:hypothetical protein